MPTRRVFELALLVTLFSHPAFKLARMWAQKSLAETEPGGIAHTVAETLVVVL